MSKIIAAQRDAYTSNFLIHGDTPEGVFLNNVLTQEIRFAYLLARLLPAHHGPRATIHDVGSGTSAFYQYMLKHPYLMDRLEYSGTEIVTEMVTMTMTKHPEITILNRDLLAAPPDERYDFLVLSGVFNLPGAIPELEWRDWTFLMMRKMFEMCRVGISFNFLTSYRTFSDPALCYIDPMDVFEFAIREISPNVIVDNSGPLYEHTVSILRSESHATRN